MKTNLKYCLFTLLFYALDFNAFSQGYGTSITGSTDVVYDEGEAHIVINPTDSSRMVVGFMVVNTLNDLSFAIYSSQDAGNTWQASSFDPIDPLVNEVPGYTNIGGGDIVFAYDRSGNVYCSWVGIWSDLNSTNYLDSCRWISGWAKSTDDGLTFTTETGGKQYFGEGLIGLNGGFTIYDSADGITDRQWMAVDLSTGPDQDKLYVGYINYPYNIANTGIKVKSKAATSNSFSSEQTAYLGDGHLTNIGIDQNGVLHFTFVDFAINHVIHVSSTDGGQSFSSPHLVYRGQNLFPPTNHKINRRENSAPSLAIDDQNNLHLVWADFPNGQQLPSSYYATSSDGGQTWSTARELSEIFNDRVFMPVVSVYDNRVSIAGNVLDANKKSTYYLVLSEDNGSNFGNPVRMSSGITDFASLSLQEFVGDYSSSARTYCNIYSLWTDCSDRNNGCKQYVAKYDQCANVGLVELTPFQSDFNITNLYPNPTKNNLTLVVNSRINGHGKAEIVDIQGKTLTTTDVTLSIGENNLELLTSELQQGNYFVRFSDENNTYLTRTFIKN